MNVIEEMTKGCDKECRIQFLGRAVTCMAYTPMYNKEGVNLNPDRNRTRDGYRCRTCGRFWMVYGNVHDGPEKIVEETK